MHSRDVVERALADWAAATESVRAALLVGSRAAAQAPVDELSDYDLLLFVQDRELEDDREWLRTFGEVLVQLDTGYELLGRWVPTRLVQYVAGLRIDFSLCPLDLLERFVRDGRLPDALDAGYRVLLDRDGLAARLPPASGRAFVPPRPSAERYARVVNEFWWETLYVAKNLARGEVLPARFSAERVLRFDCLVPMLEWYVETLNGWTRPLGVAGRGIPGLLPAAERASLDRTYAGAGVEENWQALFAMADLFERVALAVAADLDYAYPQVPASGTRAYVERLRAGSPP